MLRKRELRASLSLAVGQERRFSSIESPATGEDSFRLHIKFCQEIVQVRGRQPKNGFKNIPVCQARNSLHYHHAWEILT